MAVRVWRARLLLLRLLLLLELALLLLVELLLLWVVYVHGYLARRRLRLPLHRLLARLPARLLALGQGGLPVLLVGGAPVDGHLRLGVHVALVCWRMGLGNTYGPRLRRGPQAVVFPDAQGKDHDGDDEEKPDIEDAVYDGAELWGGTQPAWVQQERSGKDEEPEVTNEVQNGDSEEEGCALRRISRAPKTRSRLFRCTHVADRGILPVGVHHDSAVRDQGYGDDPGQNVNRTAEPA